MKVIKFNYSGIKIKSILSLGFLLNTIRENNKKERQTYSLFSIFLVDKDLNLIYLR